MKFYKFLLIIIIFLVLSSHFVNAEEMNLSETMQNELTVSDAVEYAIIYSRNLINMKEKFYETNENLEDANIEKYEPYNVNLEVKIKTLENYLNNYNINSSIEKENINISIYEIFASIINIQNEIDLYKYSINIYEKEFKIAEIKYNLGLLSESDYDNYKSSYDKKLLFLDSKKASVDEAFISLNKIMGMPIENKYKLILDLNYSEIGNIDLDKKIKAAISENQTIKEKEENIEVMEYEKSKYSNDTVSYYEQLTKEYEIEQSKRDLTDEEKKIEMKIISTYNDIIAYENSYNKNIINLNSLEKDLNIKKTQLSQGNITNIEVEKCEYEIKALKNTIQSQIYAHEILVMKFNNPNLL